MIKNTDRVVAYVALGAYCLLTSVRDVVSEGFFKDSMYQASPIFVLFVYSAVTQLSALFVLFKDGATTASSIAPIRKHWSELFWLNVFTLTAFSFYFLAVNTPLGATVNSFVDYGTSPIFTVLVAMFLAEERFGKTFVLAAAVSVLGIVILAAPRIHISGISLLWFFGLVFAALSSLSLACYRVHFKLLLQNGFTKSAIIFFRMCGTTVVLGVALAIQPKLFRADLIPQIALVGFLGLTLPLFLVLTVLQRIALGNYAMLLFCVPVTTYFLSAGFGYGQFYASDLLAAALILVAVGLYEARSRMISEGSGVRT